MINVPGPAWHILNAQEMLARIIIVISHSIALDSVNALLISLINNNSNPPKTVHST